jgi:transcriptional/translational regulatory protein YebC/TACO1
MFTEKGVIVIENDGKIDEDQLMEDALEAGAADFAAEDEAFEISTEPTDLNAVREALEAKGYTIASADTDKVPSSYVSIDGEDDVKNMTKLLEALDDNDDVIEVYHNWENMPED